MAAVKCKRCGKEWGRDAINQGMKGVQIVSPKGRPDDARVFWCPEDGHPLVLIWDGFVYSLVLEHGTSTWQY